MNASIILKVAYTFLILGAILSLISAIINLIPAVIYGPLAILGILNGNWSSLLYLVIVCLILLNSFLLFWFARGIKQLNIKRTRWLLMYTLILFPSFIFYLSNEKTEKFWNGELVSSVKTYSEAELILFTLFLAFLLILFFRAYKVIKLST